MKTRLSKIARELNSGISLVVEFLKANGYDCEEDPNETVSEEITEIIYNNFQSFLAEKNKNVSKKKNVNPKEKTIVKPSNVDIPLEIKIIEAADKEKKLIERIIGFTDYSWEYTIAKFAGTCSQPVDFNLFDEVICDLLIIESMSASKIGSILGFDIDKDPAEKEILVKAIKDLKNDKMIDGDESILWLTDIGVEYAKNGVKFSNFTRDFDLFIDSVGLANANVKATFSNLKSEKVEIKIQNTAKHRIINVAQSLDIRTNNVADAIFEIVGRIINDQEQLLGYISTAEYISVCEYYNKNLPETISLSKSPTSLDEIRLLAEEQAPEIHFPKKKYILQECTPKGTEIFKAKLWVILLENFRDNTLRTLVYDEKQNIILESLSDALDKNENIKVQLFEKLIKVDEEIEITNEEKDIEQLNIEQKLIDKQEEIEHAIDNHNTIKIKEIEKEIDYIKRHFNSIEFEIELKRLFDETTADLWIISPWIRNATFKRIPFIENYLKKGGRVFVAYSEPEAEGQIMALDEPLNKLLDLEKRYQNFYIHQLPAFHYKNVWLRFEEATDLYYSGSFNILSFFISHNLQKVRQEKMTRMDWNIEIEDEYQDVFKQFGLKYVNRTIEEFNTICQNPPQEIDRAYLQMLKKIDYLKLKPFINKNIENFDEAFKVLEETKLENINYYRKIFFELEFEKYKNKIESLSNETIIPLKKTELLNEVEKFKVEFEDIIDYENGFFNVLTKSIKELKTFNISNNNYNKNKIKKR